MVMVLMMLVMMMIMMVIMVMLLTMVVCVRFGLTCACVWGEGGTVWVDMDYQWRVCDCACV